MLSVEINRRRMKNMFRTDYLIKLKREDIEKYGDINKKTITITDKKLSYNLVKENIELKQKIIEKEKRILELEKELLELKKQMIDIKFPLVKPDSSEEEINKFRFNPNEGNDLYKLNSPNEFIEEYDNIFE